MPDLTKTEQYILDRRLEKRPFKAIAQDLGLAIGTISVHHARAQEKLGAESFRGALRAWKAWRVTNAEWYVPPDPTVIKDLRRTASSST